ncbi:Cro/CI family transcriptional regulator [Comamonas sp. SY3]|uniref:Cro/CI family transcriptional regulator n=1 Tax=Comamonas sp. SY3 TaxID=3243601 RepID=UPI0035947585
MKKADAIELLGGSVAVAAKAIGINPQAISQWPDVLPARLVDRVIAACVRTGIAVPDRVLGARASVEVPHV